MAPFLFGVILIFALLLWFAALKPIIALVVITICAGAGLLATLGPIVVRRNGG